MSSSAGGPSAGAPPAAPVAVAQAPTAPTAVPPSAEAGGRPAIVDVWSRTEPKYRVRATFFLFINLALFCGLCVFTHWLHVGQPFDFSLDSYVRPLRFWGPQTQSLYDFVLYPISVDQTPIYGVVVGLLVASIVAIPIGVAILYRFPCSLPFCAAVLVFAHMPWMGLTLVGSCILASVKPFRMSFRFGSALAGLLPVLLYLYLATRGSTEALAASISPERKLLLTYPWLLAILAACVMLALIIIVARLVNFRPGAVAPLMAVMFATPAILFHQYVGVDELAYRVLEMDYGPRAKRFEPLQDATEFILDFMRRQAERPTGQGWVLEALSTEHPAEHIAAAKHRIAVRLLLELMRDRQRAYEACKSFIADHPNSRFVPNVLYVQARALDTRFDGLRFGGTTTQRELYTDYPHAQSEPIWVNLLTQYPQSPLAVAARLRVAQLRLRADDAAGALAVLSPPASASLITPETQPARRPLLKPRAPESSLDFEPEPYLFEARRLRELIVHNGADPKYGTQPLQALAALDPHRRGYHDQLALLASQYPDSLLYDNLVVRWASAQTDRETRFLQLRACLERIAEFPDQDALPEAMFQLADLEVQALGTGDETRRAAGIARFRQIVDRFGNTCWAGLAAERLRVFNPPADVATRPLVVAP